MLHVFKTSPGSQGVHSISNYVNQGKGRKKCDRPIVHDYLKKNKFIDATFEKICPHCVYPQAGRGVSEKVSAVGFCLGSGLFGSCNSD